MYVYRSDNISAFSVGFYDPTGEWHHESAHATVEGAASRVHWLNGGSETQERNCDRERFIKPVRESINAIIGFSELILEELEATPLIDIDPKAQCAELDKVNDAVNRVKHLLNTETPKGKAQLSINLHHPES